MFDEVIDHEKIKTILTNFICTNHFPHSLLFYGPRGVGKFLMAKSIVKYFNCKNSNEKSRGKDNCSICRRIDEEIYPDLFIIRTEKIIKKSGEVKDSKEIKKDQIKQVIKQMQYKSFEGDYKFYIIDGAEAMNNISENAFLKTLEEPLPNNYIILISHNINTMLPTILSRCIKIKFESLKYETLKRIIQNKYNLDSDLTAKISLLANGSMKQAEILIEDEMYEEIFKLLDDFIKCITNKEINIDALFLFSKKINNLELQYINYMFDLLLIYLHESYLMSVYNENHSNIFKYYLNFKTKNIKLNSYNIIINKVLKSKYFLLNTNVEMKLLIEDLVLSIRKNLL